MSLREIWAQADACARKRESTDVEGNTTFSKLTEEWRFNLKNIIVSGGLGTIANALSESASNKVGQILDNRLSNQLAGTRTSGYRALIKKAIQDENPDLGNRGVNKLVNQRLNQIRGLLRKQTKAAKVAAQQAIDKSIERFFEKLKSNNE